MFAEKTTVAEKIIELRDKNNLSQDGTIFENDLDKGFVVINQNVYEIEEMALAEGKFTMSMPTEFEHLDKSLVESKYPNMLRPQYIYSDKTTLVNLTFTLDDKIIVSEEVEELKENLICIMSDIHPEYEIIDEVIIHADNTTIATFGFTKSTLDGEIYQMIFLMSLNEKLLLGGFNCDVQVKEEWYPVIHQMVQTIRPNN